MLYNFWYYWYFYRFIISYITYTWIHDPPYDMVYKNKTPGRVYTQKTNIIDDGKNN